MNYNNIDVIDMIPLQSIIYKQFIKHNRLDNLINIEFNNVRTNVINIFIDCYQIFNPLYRFYRVNNPLSITSCMMNMAIHYRWFFKKYGVHTHIFLLYSPTMSTNNTRFCPEYNNKYRNRMLNNKVIYENVNQNLSLMNTLVSYMPDIYLKIGTVETSVMAADIINKFESKGYCPPNIFISSSQYAFQLPSFNNRIVLFCPKRTNQQTSDNNDDISYSVNYTNNLNRFISETRNQDMRDIQLDQSWISGFMILSGIPKRDVKSLLNYRETLKVLKKIKDSFDIITPEVLHSTITELYPDKNIGYTDIINRYNCIDIKYQLQLYRTLPESSENGYLTQFPNQKELFKINEKYFKDEPIMLDRL